MRALILRRFFPYRVTVEGIVDRYPVCGTGPPPTTETREKGPKKALRRQITPKEATDLILGEESFRLPLSGMWHACLYVVS